MFNTPFDEKNSDRLEPVSAPGCLHFVIFFLVVQIISVYLCRVDVEFSAGSPVARYIRLQVQCE